MQSENNTGEQSLDQNHHLSHKETRQIVTPYAFHVSPDLFGTALARPLKRGIAIGIDALLISILSQSAGFLLAGVAAVTFFRAGNRLKLKKRFNMARLALRFIAATLLFVFALGIFNSMGSKHAEDSQDQPTSTISGFDAIAVVANTTKYMLAANALAEKVEEGECPNIYLCWQALGNEATEALIKINLPHDDAMDMLEGFLEIAQQQLNEQEKEALLLQWQTQLSEATEQNDSNNIMQDITPPVPEVNAPKEPVNQLEESTEKQPSKTSIVAWLEGILEDLGLGFGWAAFYFSIFTAWWRGQTPGKKLLGIKVIKLDGKEPNLWESFGRYGGYGAGFATGLLGFLQIYWDPNRQAIQDKISETVVIDLRIAKINFVQESENTEPLV